MDYCSWKGELVHSFRPPGALLIKSQGSLRALLDDNALSNRGSKVTVTEYNSSGDLV